MHHILLIFGGLIIAAGALIAVLARFNVVNVNRNVSDKVQQVLPDKLTDSESGIFPREVPKDVPLGRGELLEILESSISAVNKRIDELPKVSQTTPVTNQTQSSSTQTTTTSSTGPKVAYIPVGNTGSGNSSTDFSSVSGHEVTIDTGSYPGYKQMVLEANFRMFQGNGTGEVRFYNKTDGTAVTNSTLSTTSQDYATKTSSGFSIASGSKTYTVQVKSSTGYSVDLQWSRIRVDF